MPCRPSVQAGGGQGVRSDPESEESEEKYRAVIKGSSPHYGGEGVTHSPIVPTCLLTARYGRFRRDPRRPVCVPASNRVSNPISGSEVGSDAQAGVGERNST